MLARTRGAFTGSDGRPLLATGSDDRSVRVWDPASGTTVTVLDGHTDWVRAMCAFTSSEGRALLATGSNDRTVRIWDPRTAECLIVIPVHHEVHVLTQVDAMLIVGTSAGILAIELH